MMNKAYILENGILELYLLSELDEQEQIQVEDVLNSDSELQTILSTLETNFEKLAFENAINPPKTVKDNLVQAVKNSTSKVIPLQKTNQLKTYVSFAASIAFFLLIGSIWMFYELGKTKQQLQIVKEQKLLFLKDIESLNSNLKNVSKWADVIRSPDVEQYIINGNDLAPNAKIVSYINHKEKTVIINTKNLPTIDNSHDYQMWANVEGNMINMGVITKNTPLLVMNYIDNAKSLNITIELAGGNDHPTVSRLVGNVYL
jgi:hypothetical protein